VGDGAAGVDEEATAPGAGGVDAGTFADVAGSGADSGGEGVDAGASMTTGGGAGAGD